MACPDDVSRRKAELRRAMRVRRGLASAAGAAAALAANLDSAGMLPLVPVAGYWPLAGELDPRPAMARLAGAGRQLVLPRMRGPTQPLEFRVWQPGDRLVEGAFGVMEPRADAPLLAPEVVLVPLLAFDRRGGRLGYGKGYYDRTLVDLRRRPPGCLAIGIALALQEVDEVPMAPSDQRLNAVVTEAAAHWFDPAVAGESSPAASA